MGDKHEIFVGFDGFDADGLPVAWGLLDIDASLAASGLRAEVVATLDEIFVEGGAFAEAVGCEREEIKVFEFFQGRVVILK